MEEVYFSQVNMYIIYIYIYIYIYNILHGNTIYKTHFYDTYISYKSTYTYNQRRWNEFVCSGDQSIKIHVMVNTTI